MANSRKNKDTGVHPLLCRLLLHERLLVNSGDGLCHTGFLMTTVPGIKLRRNLRVFCKKCNGEVATSMWST